MSQPVLNPTPLTALTVNITGGVQVMTSSTGEYEIDQGHGVIHTNLFAPTTSFNGGPSHQNIYTIHGILPGGNPITLVSMNYIDMTSTGTARFSHNFGPIIEPDAQPG